jgi:SAM-dependent methyltransferase
LASSTVRPINSQFAYFDALKEVTGAACTWLDLGCGHQFVPTWVDATGRTLPPRGCRTVGIDMDRDAIRVHPSLRHRVIGTIERLPVREASADLVTANMVLEHVEDPGRLFEEVARVLKPGGTFLLHTPNRVGYTTRLTKLIPSGLRPAVARLLQGRKEEDVYRTWYRANTIPELNSLAGQAGFHVVDLRTVESSAQLYRVPVVGRLEEQWLKLIRRDALSAWRPCILARLGKPLPH